MIVLFQVGEKLYLIVWLNLKNSVNLVDLVRQNGNRIFIVTIAPIFFYGFSNIITFNNKAAICPEECFDGDFDLICFECKKHDPFHLSKLAKSYLLLSFPD